MTKKTVVLGASENPLRYSFQAVRQLEKHHHPVQAIGIREGKIGEVKIETGQPPLREVDTVTLYLNAGNQRKYYDYILSIHPRRLIFNPGAENAELFRLAAENGIVPVEACTLVLLSTGQY